MTRRREAAGDVFFSYRMAICLVFRVGEKGRLFLFGVVLSHFSPFSFSSHHGVSLCRLCLVISVLLLQSAVTLSFLRVQFLLPRVLARESGAVCPSSVGVLAFVLPLTVSLSPIALALSVSVLFALFGSSLSAFARSLPILFL